VCFIRNIAPLGFNTPQLAAGRFILSNILIAKGPISTRFFGWADGKKIEARRGKLVF